MTDAIHEEIARRLAEEPVRTRDQAAEFILDRVVELSAALRLVKDKEGGYGDERESGD